MVEDQPPACFLCNSSPCEGLEFGEMIIAEMEEMYILTNTGEQLNENGQVVSNLQMHKHLYHMFMYKKHGHLGKGICVQLPQCILECIRNRYPDPSGAY